MRVFATGSTGFIGSAVIKDLLAAGHEVLGLTRSDKGAEWLTTVGASVHRGTLTDLESLRAGAVASDAVLHLAFVHDFSNYQSTCLIDREAITTIGTAIEGTNKPFIITSGTLMMRAGQLGTEDDSYDSESPVASARGASEPLLHSFAAKGVRTVALRLPPTNHGAGDKGFIAMLVNAAKTSGVSAYIGDGESRWPATHVLDTARAYRLALEKAFSGETSTGGATFHVVAEEGVRIKDVAEAIGKQLGLPVVSKTMEDAQKELGFMAIGVATDNPSSSVKTKSFLGWVPEHPNLLADIAQGTYTS